MKGALRESDLAAQLSKMGINCPPNNAAGQEELQKMKEAQVLSSLKNLEPMQPEVSYPAQKVMLKGGKNADPETIPKAHATPQLLDHCVFSLIFSTSE